jgi:hypothetical protein
MYVDQEQLNTSLPQPHVRLTDLTVAAESVVSESSVGAFYSTRIQNR